MSTTSSPVFLWACPGSQEWPSGLHCPAHCAEPLRVPRISERHQFERHFELSKVTKICFCTVSTKVITAGSSLRSQRVVQASAWDIRIQSDTDRYNRIQTDIDRCRYA